VERVDIFDEDWNPTGEVLEKSEAERQGKWHTAVCIGILNPKGELLLQLRSPKKDKPNMWDISAGGHVQAGESLVQAAIREVREEIGVDVTADQLIEAGRGKSTKSQHLFILFLARLDLPIEAFASSDEVAGVKYMPWRELAQMSADDMLVNHIWPSKAFKPLFDYLGKNEAK